MSPSKYPSRPRKAALRAARAERRVQRASLHVAAANAAGRALYGSLGFATDATVEAYYPDGGAALRLALDLG